MTDTNPASNFFGFMKSCQMAMTALQERTGDKTYAARAKKGKMQLVRITYPNGQTSAHVEEVSQWIPVSGWLDFIAKQSNS